MVFAYIENSKLQKFNMEIGVINTDTILYYRFYQGVYCRSGIMEYFGLTDVLLIIAAGLLFLRYLSKDKSGPPGPWGLPLLGYLPFLGSDPPRKYFELSKKYGPVISVKLGPETFTVLNDYEVIHEALVRRGDVFSGRPNNKFTESFSGARGILFHQYDSDLKTQRKFVLQTLRGFGIEKESIEAKVLDEVEYLLDEIRSTSEEPIDCRTLLAHATANVTCNVILGSRYSYQNEEFRAMVNVIKQDVTSDRVTSLCINLMMVAPSLRHVPPFSNAFKAIMDGRNLITDMLEKVVQEHRDNLDSQHPRDFIDEYLVEIDKKDKATCSFYESQLYTAISDLFIGGTETTSTTIQWAMLLLAHRRDIQNKLQQEISRIVGAGRPSEKHRSIMPYFNAFIHELMRHKTLVPLSIPHCVTEDVLIQGCRIPKGGSVLFNLWAVHYNPENFKSPEEFIPERFIDDNGNFFKDPKLIPFSAGPRVCIGEYIAKVEVFLFLSSIIQRFEVLGDPAASLPSFADGVLGQVYVPKKFKVYFTPR